MNSLTPQQRRELVAHALCDDLSARKAYRGKKLRASTIERIRRSALALGFPPPPAQPESK